MMVQSYPLINTEHATRFSNAYLVFTRIQDVYFISLSSYNSIECWSGGAKHWIGMSENTCICYLNKDY